MTKILFSQMNLTPKVSRAVDKMGFDAATPIQSQAIPVIRTGVDVIARSQTGTGKTVAFSIPAIERVDTHELKPTIQVLILCPTRELAQQANEELCKLARYKEGIRSVAVYGGAPIDKQCIALRRANVVVGTPGRVMDHMRRKSIKLDHLKMIVLDEADEMLNMGFKEDIEVILKETPDTRQTVFFSATMPPAIMKITREFQKDPQIIEIEKLQTTIDTITQKYVAVPHGRKKDAVAVLLKHYRPRRSIVFCATKRMADELTEFLNEQEVPSACIHSDIKQSLRTSTMNGFKAGKIAVLVATDIAARGIDVSDVEYVINFDLPPNSEHYIHRVGRTGRAGKDGSSITVCGSRREVQELGRIAAQVKADIQLLPMPTTGDVVAQALEEAKKELEGRLAPGCDAIYYDLADQLEAAGYTLRQVAACALAQGYPMLSKPLEGISADFPADPYPANRRREEVGAKTGARSRYGNGGEYTTLVLDMGRESRVDVRNIVGAITERAGIPGKEIGKVVIDRNKSFVDISSGEADKVLQAMEGCKICGRTAHFAMGTAAPVKKRSRPYGDNSYRGKSGDGPKKKEGWGRR